MNDVSKYKVTIGLEVHVQLKTKSKMFCTCSAEYFGAKPNTHVCPVCLGLPGALPVPNKEAITKSVSFGLALNCEISTSTKFDRKNYFYPDLPKGYQISQFDNPISKAGVMELEPYGQTKKVRINRAHLEEDTGKLNHSTQMSASDSEKFSLVDFNRCGVPLLEIVSEPDLDSPAEARACAEKIHQIARYIGAADTEMEKAGMRFDGNISLRPEGQKELGTKVEVKNINSFRFLEKALEYEIGRQTELLDKGERIVQETRGYVEDKGITISQRSKEESPEYRYFPEPDIPEIKINDELMNKSKQVLVELPEAKVKRFQENYNLNLADSLLLTVNKNVADWFEKAVSDYQEVNKGELKELAKKMANWILNDLFSYLNTSGQKFEAVNLEPAQLVELIYLVDQGKVNQSSAKEVFKEMIKSGVSAEQIVKDKGLESISDEGEVEKFASEVISEQTKAVEDFKAGKEAVLGFLVGQLMAKARGKADPNTARKTLLKLLR